MAGLTDHVEQHEQLAIRRLGWSEPRPGARTDITGSNLEQVDGQPWLTLAPKPGAIYTFGVEARERWGLE